MFYIHISYYWEHIVSCQAHLALVKIGPVLAASFYFLLVPVIGMDGAMATMSRLDFKCPIGKGSVETMSHYILET